MVFGSVAVTFPVDRKSSACANDREPVIAIRAIEIEEYKKAHPLEQNEFPPLNSLVIGVDIDRELRRKKISKRLKARLEDGMIEEIKDLFLWKGKAIKSFTYLQQMKG